MDHKERYAALRPAIRRVLMEKWDPLAVSDLAEAAHEYDNYIPGLYSLLAGEAPDEQIVAHLRKIETEWMGLGAQEQERLQTVVGALRQAFGAD